MSLRHNLYWPIRSTKAQVGYEVRDRKSFGEKRERANVKSQNTHVFMVLQDDCMD